MLAKQPGWQHPDPVPASLSPPPPTDSSSYLGSDELSIELPLEEVVRVAATVGLRLVRQEMVSAPYMGEGNRHRRRHRMLCALLLHVCFCRTASNLSAHVESHSC